MRGLQSRTLRRAQGAQVILPRGNLSSMTIEVSSYYLGMAFNRS
jgi:hypothetical protein